MSDEPAARHEHIRLTVDFGRVQALDLFVIKMSYDLSRLISCASQSSHHVVWFRLYWIQSGMRAATDELALGLSLDQGRDESAAGGDVERQVHGIGGLPMHLACGSPVIRSPSRDLGEQRVRDFDEIGLRTVGKVHRLEIMAQH